MKSKYEEISTTNTKISNHLKIILLKFGESHFIIFLHILINKTSSPARSKHIYVYVYYRETIYI